MNGNSSSIQRRLAIQMALTNEDIEARLKPINPEPTTEQVAISKILIEAAKKLRDATPASREQALLFTKLEEAHYWSEMALSRNPAGAAVPKLH